MIDKTLIADINGAVIEKNGEPKKSRVRWTDRIASRFQTIHEFMLLTKRSGRALWLIPMMCLLMLLGLLLGFIQVIEYVAPFVYTIF